MSNNSSDSNHSSQRRQLLKVGTLGLLGAVVASRVIAPESAFAQAPQDVKESDGNAKALCYHDDVTKVDAKKCPKITTDKTKNAHCYNCMFYMTKEADPTKTEKAPCTIFANKNVKAKGWCQSWAQNPKVKG